MNEQDFSETAGRSKWSKIKSKLTKKRLIIGGIILLVAGFFVFRSGANPADSIQTDTVKKGDLKKSVLATGQVTSETDLALAFKVSGVIQKVDTKVGAKVRAGQALAFLDQKDQLARLTQARGALKLAEANLQKVLDGASSEEATAAKVTLDNAKKTLEDTKRQQNVLVDNAYAALINNDLSAVPDTGNSGSVTATISGAYSGKDQGIYKVSIYSSGTLRFQYNGLEVGTGEVRTAPQALGTRGLYIQFSSTSVPVNNTWTVRIPNDQSSSYITYYNAYNSAIETQKAAITAAENAVASAQAAYDLKIAKASTADLDAVEAQVLSAQGQLQSAAADLENTVLRAPSAGTVTSVDIKVGELATALKQAVVVQDVENLHIEANISEANISAIKLDQVVEVNFDALGTDRKFNAKVQAVDPASSLVSGVVNYKVTITLDKLQDIKPGMTANINIITGEKLQALYIPSRAVINKEGKKYVRVVTETKTKAFSEKEVEVGQEYDGGFVEVLGGLNLGEEVVTFIKK